MREAIGTITARDFTTDQCCAELSVVNSGCGKDETYFLIVITLDPCEQAQKRQCLRLDFQSNVEISDNVIHAQWDSSPGPKHHHGRLQTSGVVSAVIDNDLRDELQCTLGHVNYRPAKENSVTCMDQNTFCDHGLISFRAMKTLCSRWLTAPMVPSTLAAMGTSILRMN